MATDVERARQERATQYWLNCLDHASCAPTMADFAGAEVRRTVGEITAKLRESAMHYRKIEPNWPGDVAEGQAVAVEDAALWIEREFGGAK